MEGGLPLQRNLEKKKKNSFVGFNPRELFLHEQFGKRHVENVWSAVCSYNAGSPPILSAFFEILKLKDGFDIAIRCNRIISHYFRPSLVGVRTGED